MTEKIRVQVVFVGSFLPEIACCLLRVVFNE